MYQGALSVLGLYMHLLRVRHRDGPQEGHCPVPLTVLLLPISTDGWMTLLKEDTGKPVRCTASPATWTTPREAPVRHTLATQNFQ
jgi:hypothetical protein